MTMQEVVVGAERLPLGKLIGKGGEGEVYSLNGRSGQAVKIYKRQLRAKREEKVRAMVQEGLAAKTDLVAYPHEIVTCPRGEFLGFLMRLISGYRPIHQLYTPKSRQQTFPNADYRFIVRAAANIARAIAKVHQTGCVVGDFNHSGVLVSPKALVALIDADSFQFSLGGKTFHCVVGVADFTPPELHGVDLSLVKRTIDHDNFGLAVAIFQLLFMGCHPYAGVYKGADISLAEAIAQNRFAFSLVRRPSTKTIPPPNALPMQAFPVSVRNGFEQAFGLNSAVRPNAEDWVNILTRLEGSLSRCGKVKSHYYPRTVSSCVWCELAQKSGYDMFPDLGAVSPRICTDTRPTELAIKEIQSFRFPTAADLIPASIIRTSGGSEALREAKSAIWGRVLWGILLLAGAGCLLFYATGLWLLWLGLGWWGFTFLSENKIGHRPFYDAFKKADERVQHELDEFVRRNQLAEIIRVRSDLEADISAYCNIDQDLAREMVNLKSTRESRQRRAFLDKFSIRFANISGIGPAKTAMLISFGIETAADVTPATVGQVPGFGPVMTDKLVQWRWKHEAKFRYNPAPTASDVAAERALRAKFARRKAELDAKIQSGLRALQAAKPRLASLATKAHNDQDLLLAVQDRARAERDLSLLGASIPSSNVVLKVPAATPSSRQPQSPPPSPMGVTHTQTAGGAPNCPRCGAPMRRRTAKRGRWAGNQFWDCSRFPSCRGTRN